MLSAIGGTAVAGGALNSGIAEAAPAAPARGAAAEDRGTPTRARSSGFSTV
ncbi:glycoside hydrolase [Streptomyces alboflavus]|uniref:Glycoside hydrolase n=1 Tax=Streptomyces alboflavus TaxID=67267 RepID=A0A1Z1WNR9_9ACTN|nr:glycoside hydrolase [Streptomyces alboflavus]